MNRTDTRLQLVGVRDALGTVHERLVASLRAGLEKLHGRIGPGQVLQLLLHDPLFAWLRPMSGLMIEIDDLVDDEEASVDASTFARVRRTIESWIDANANYRELLLSDPDVVMAHAALRTQLEKERTT